MNITDEHLAAFLDAELPEAEMELIREQLMLDENLAKRLAELTVVDEVVTEAYTEIDSHPFLRSVNASLSKQANPVAEKSGAKGKSNTAKIITFPTLQTFQSVLQKHMAIAAGVVMVLGLGAIKLLHETNTGDNWQNVATLLETSPSGVTESIQGTQVKPRITFINKQGEYCRQFEITTKKTFTENIACRKGSEWKIAVSVTLDKSQESYTQKPDEHQTARGGSILDSTIDDMIGGSFLDAQAESKIIEQHWSKN